MHLNPDPTPQQQHVLVLLAQGQTISEAAASVGIHRNTIANWRRSSESFRDLWHNMQYEQAMHWRDELQSIAQVALDSILKIITDEKAPAAIRLRAALSVVDKVTAIPPSQPVLKQPGHMHDAAQTAQAPSPDEDAPDFRQPANTAQSAQPCTIGALGLFNDSRHLDDSGLDSLLAQMCAPPSMHNPAQSDPSRPHKSHPNSK